MKYDDLRGRVSYSKDVELIGQDGKIIPVGGAVVGSLVNDYVLNKNGIVVSNSWTEALTGEATDWPYEIVWELLVLYEDGIFDGANKTDLQVIR